MTIVHEPYEGSQMVVDTAAVLDAAKHLTRVIVVGIEPDGGLYVAGTHGGAESVELLAMGARAIVGDVPEPKFN
jgi:hypothetical protein